MSGLDLLTQLASRQLDILPIMITAYASIETAVTATKQGAFDFLAKPFTPMELKETIYKAAKHLIPMRQAHKLALEKRKVRIQFISVLAHEMKAPLAALDGYLNILRERAAGDSQEVYDHMVDRCLTRIQGMRKMIGDLLDLTRIESGERKREFAEVDVREVVQTAIDTALAEAQERNISVVMQADGPVPMQADRSEIEIILNNLITNAVKYNRDGGSVAVRLASQDGTVSISVRDTGIGMTTEEAARLFNDFVASRREDQKHSGQRVGLSTVKKLRYCMTVRLRLRLSLIRAVSLQFIEQYHPHRRNCRRACEKLIFQQTVKEREGYYAGRQLLNQAERSAMACRSCTRQALPGVSGIFQPARQSAPAA